MGTYKGTNLPKRQNFFTDNLPELQRFFPFNPQTGYFGSRGKSASSKVRNIASSNPAKTAADFYEKASKGGIEVRLPNQEGVITTLPDGTTITFRPHSHSSDHSPAININPSRTANAGGIKL